MDDTTIIREQNDAFRCHTAKAIAKGIKGHITNTQGIAAKSEKELTMILDHVRMFGDYEGLEFTEENDPHQEHDFGTFDYQGEKISWKIDYYNLDLTAGSEDPSDIKITHRILTIMLADEY